MPFRATWSMRIMQQPCLNSVLWARVRVPKDGHWWVWWVWAEGFKIVLPCPESPSTYEYYKDCKVGALGPMVKSFPFLLKNKLLSDVLKSPTWPTSNLQPKTHKDRLIPESRFKQTSQQFTGSRRSLIFLLATPNKGFGECGWEVGYKALGGGLQGSQELSEHWCPKYLIFCCLTFPE